MISQSHLKSLVTLKMCRSVAAWSLMLVAALASAEGSDKDCQCRAPDGQMRKLGTVECVDIVGHKRLVRCEMSTNTPYWKKIDDVEGCPAA